VKCSGRARLGFPDACSASLVTFNFLCNRNMVLRGRNLLEHHSLDALRIQDKAAGNEIFDGGFSGHSSDRISCVKEFGVNCRWVPTIGCIKRGVWSTDESYHCAACIFCSSGIESLGRRDGPRFGYILWYQQMRVTSRRISATWTSPLCHRFGGIIFKCFRLDPIRCVDGSPGENVDL